MQAAQGRVPNSCGFHTGVGLQIVSVRIVLLGDKNAKVGNREVYRVVGKYGVLGVNENGERLVELCRKKKTEHRENMVSKETDSEVYKGR